MYRCGFAAQAGGVVQPLANALQIAKTTIHEIIKAVNAEDFIIYLSGTGNYRYDIATIKPYKGNREKAERPEHYEAIREYLVDMWGAEIVDGYEADDAVGIKFTELGDNGICVSQDKDLDTIAGWHYNWVKKIMYNVSRFDAKYNLYYQALVGDTVDNIEGLKGVGPVTAKKILEHELMRAFEALLFERVLDAYVERGSSLEALGENLALLTICSTKDQLKEMMRDDRKST